MVVSLPIIAFWIPFHAIGFSLSTFLGASFHGRSCCVCSRIDVGCVSCVPQGVGEVRSSSVGSPVGLENQVCVVLMFVLSFS